MEHKSMTSCWRNWAQWKQAIFSSKLSHSIMWRCERRKRLIGVILSSADRTPAIAATRSLNLFIHLIYCWCLIFHCHQYIINGKQRRDTKLNCFFFFEKQTVSVALTSTAAKFFTSLRQYSNNDDDDDDNGSNKNENIFVEFWARIASLVPNDMQAKLCECVRALSC